MNDTTCTQEEQCFEHGVCEKVEHGCHVSQSAFVWVHRSTNAVSYTHLFQTYTYAIENYHCFAESLHEVCVQATLNDRFIFDFNAYLKRYSEIVYPLFLWNIWFYRQRDTYTFPMYDFHTYTALREISQMCIRDRSYRVPTVHGHGIKV